MSLKRQKARRQARRGAEKLSTGQTEAVAPTSFTRADRRDILRATVFLCSTPLVMPRASSGCAARSAATAASPLPDAIASSTLRRKVRIRDR